MHIWGSVPVSDGPHGVTAGRHRCHHVWGPLGAPWACAWRGAASPLPRVPGEHPADPGSISAAALASAPRAAHGTPATGTAGDSVPRRARFCSGELRVPKGDGCSCPGQGVPLPQPPAEILSNPRWVRACEGHGDMILGHHPRGLLSSPSNVTRVTAGGRGAAPWRTPGHAHGHGRSLGRGEAAEGCGDSGTTGPAERPDRGDRRRQHGRRAGLQVP